MNLSWVGFCVGMVLVVGCASAPRAPRFLVVANDEKTTWNDAGEVIVREERGQDTVTILDITKPDAPRIVTTFPVPNSVLGPPSNVAVTPDESLALVTSAVRVVREDETLTTEPDHLLHLIDLTAKPPRLLRGVMVGKQPSGVAINGRGDLALVANRADKSISVLAIEGKNVHPVDTVPLGDEVAAVAFTPDGRRALVTKFTVAKVAVLEIEGRKVRYPGVDVAVGPSPYSVVVTPDGKLAITGDMGPRDAPGAPDSLTVLDLERKPPAVVQRLDVGDGPEGLALSPDGKLLAVALLRSSNAPQNASYRHRNGTVLGIAIEGKTLRKLNEVEVRAMPEGLAFSADGGFLYVGNFLDADVSVLRVEPGRLAPTARVLRLPGHPATIGAAPARRR